MKFAQKFQTAAEGRGEAVKDKGRFLALGGLIWCMKRGIGRFLDTGRRNANFGKIGRLGVSLGGGPAGAWGWPVVWRAGDSVVGACEFVMGMV